MPFTHEDYEKQFGPGWPDFYTTPADWSQCKNLNLEGATPCWHPHCDCQPESELRRRRNWKLIWQGFDSVFDRYVLLGYVLGVAVGVILHYIATGAF
jgi:hypothetical protein